MFIFMIDRANFHMPILNGSLVFAIKPKVMYRFRMAIMLLFYVTQKGSSLQLHSLLKSIITQNFVPILRSTSVALTSDRSFYDHCDGTMKRSKL
jgi:hypothetical protein